MVQSGEGVSPLNAQFNSKSLTKATVGKEIAPLTAGQETAILGSQAKTPMNAAQTTSSLPSIGKGVKNLVKEEKK